MKGKPVTGGIVSVLQFIGVMSVLLAFFGGALANLSLGDEVVLLVSASITAVFIFAAASVIQELRNITFNTCRENDSSIVVKAQLPAEMDDAAAMQAYGIEKDGRGFRYGEYRYDNLRDAVAYAKKRRESNRTAEPSSAHNVGGLR